MHRVLLLILIVLVSFQSIGCVHIRYRVNGETRWEYKGRNWYQEAHDRANWNYITNSVVFGTENANEILKQQQEVNR